MLRSKKSKIFDQEHLLLQAKEILKKKPMDWLSSERDLLLELMQDNIPLLKNINEKKKKLFMDLIKRKISARKYKAGEIILKEGNRLEFLHLVVRGCARKYLPTDSYRAETEFGDESEMLSKRSINR